MLPVLTFYDDLGGPVWRESEGVEFPPSGYAFEVRHPMDWFPGAGKPSVVLFSWTESLRGPGQTLIGVNYWWRPVISDPFLMTVSLRIRSAVNERFHCDQVFVSLLARRRLLARVSQLFPGESRCGRVAFV